METTILIRPVASMSPDILGGTPVFAGTRVPIKNLVDYIKGGDSIDEFLDDFPSVQKDQIFGFLDQASELIVANLT